MLHKLLGRLGALSKRTEHTTESDRELLHLARQRAIGRADRVREVHRADNLMEAIPPPQDERRSRCKDASRLRGRIVSEVEARGRVSRVGAAASTVESKVVVDFAVALALALAVEVDFDFDFAIDFKVALASRARKPRLVRRLLGQYAA
jgi:hypothetical protein